MNRSKKEKENGKVKDRTLESKAVSLLLDSKFKLYLFSFVETPRKFTWCFHKAKQIYCIHHANIQET